MDTTFGGHHHDVAVAQFGAGAGEDVGDGACQVVTGLEFGERRDGECRRSPPGEAMNELTRPERMPSIYGGALHLLNGLCPG
jgi:hypothetical protein